MPGFVIDSTYCFPLKLRSSHFFAPLVEKTTIVSPQYGAQLTTNKKAPLRFLLNKCEYLKATSAIKQNVCLIWAPYNPKTVQKT